MRVHLLLFLLEKKERKLSLREREKNFVKEKNVRRMDGCRGKKEGEYVFGEIWVKVSNSMMKMAVNQNFLL